MLKIFKKTVLLLMAILTVANCVNAHDYTVPQELATYGAQVYTKARSYFGRRSFSGYCGTYVKCQLRAMGIFKDGFDFSGNGNQWYSNFEDVKKTSGGYYVYREGGSDCIDKLVEKFGTELENIVLSFPIQSGRSASSPGAGHALILYALSDGVAYYSESFSSGTHREGEVVAEDIDSLLERYSARHGNITGCVLLSEENLDMYVENASYGNEGILLMQLKERLEEQSSIEFIASEFALISQTRVVA